MENLERSLENAEKDAYQLQKLLQLVKSYRESGKPIEQVFQLLRHGERDAGQLQNRFQLIRNNLEINPRNGAEKGQLQEASDIPDLQVKTMPSDMESVEERITRQDIERKYMQDQMDSSIVQLNNLVASVG